MKVQDLYEGLRTTKDDVTLEMMSKLSDEIRQNCKDVYKNFYSVPIMQKFRHSMDDNLEDIFRVVKNREGRKPTDTPPYFHRVMDAALEERFGVKFRSNAIFTYFMPYSGSYYLLFPYDGYKMITSDQVDDMFILVRDEINDGTQIHSYIKDFIKKHARLESGENILDKHAKRISFIPSHVFPVLGMHSWLKEDDFPSVPKFITQFKNSVSRMMGDDVIIEAEEKDYAELLQRVIKTVNDALIRSVESYTIAKKPEDIVISNDKHHEVMIHSSHFVLVDIRSILEYLVDKGYDYSENQVIQMLYKKDLTAFE